MIKLCNEICELGVSEKDIQNCYGMSKMTIWNEVENKKEYFKMQWVEFLEFIGRLANVRDKNSDSPLELKIENLLDDIFSHFGFNRNEVNVQLEEISESDDDY